MIIAEQVVQRQQCAFDAETRAAFRAHLAVRNGRDRMRWRNGEGVAGVRERVPAFPLNITAQTRRRREDRASLR